LQNENEVKTEADSQTNRTDKLSRRKRINRIKTTIIVIAVVLLILPTVVCIILGLQVSRLQKQVRELAALHGQNELADQDGENYAYAAEITQAIQDAAAIQEDNHHNNVTPQATPLITPHVTPTLTPVPLTEPVSEEPKTTVSPTTITPTTVPDDKKSDVEIESTSIKNGKYSGKKVYLTFDDGPSINTNDILDILSEYGIKATFFVIGKTDDKSKKLYKRIVEEGHTLGMHSYSHKYEKIYNSAEDFDKDFTKLWKLLYDTTGYKPFLYRFPGGSNNKVNKYGMEEFIRYLNKSSILYFDWNVVNGDATGIQYTKEQLIANVLNGVAEKKNPIVLMHDARSKETTVESLPGLLDQLILGGAQILPLDKDVKPIQMIKADSIK
jgi:peptidoglycan/xylan/chitin deacetylase (PgdA/CDA1 family)